MQLRTLTDNELLLLVDNLPGADELLRELASRLRYDAGQAERIRELQAEIRRLEDEIYDRENAQP